MFANGNGVNNAQATKATVAANHAAHQDVLNSYHNAIAAGASPTVLGNYAANAEMQLHAERINNALSSGTKSQISNLVHGAETGAIQWTGEANNSANQQEFAKQLHHDIQLSGAAPQLSGSPGDQSSSGVTPSNQSTS